MKTYNLECFTESQVKSLGADLSKNNEDITETAGFVPLEVKLRRFQENGQVMQFSSSEFTSSDLRDLYLSPDLEITPEMELEEIQEVQLKRQQFLRELIEKKAKSKASVDTSAEAAAAGSQKEEVQTSETKE